jgi:hypothetical protein
MAEDWIREVVEEAQDAMVIRAADALMRLAMSGSPPWRVRHPGATVALDAAMSEGDTDG